MLPYEIQIKVTLHSRRVEEILSLWGNFLNKANENVTVFRELSMKEPHGEVKCNLLT